MKKILLASVALVSFTAAASAADLPSRRVAPVVAAVPVFTWTGFYAGVNAGFGFNSNDSIVLSNGVVVDAVDGDDDAGFIGGAQIGFNYQMGSFVVGVEGDLQYADFGDARYTIPGVVGTWEGESDDWFGTARARAGVAFDRALVYATGGFAYGGADDNNDFFSNNDDVRTGWVLGAGFEYAFTNNLTAGIEGLWVNLDNDNRTYVGSSIPAVGAGRTAVDVAGFDRDSDNDFFVARAKLNYKFSSY